MDMATVGRLVRYDGRPAIVTAVDDLFNDVALTVFDVNGIRFYEEVPYADVPTVGHWNWPPRV